MKADFGRSAQSYGAHRAGFPVAFYDRLRAHGVGVAPQRLVDIGTGTGTLARHFAANGVDVVGVDPSSRMLNEADRLARLQGVTARWQQAPGERTGLPDNSFEVAIAGQCWHWLDGPAAATESRRLLVAGGKLVIAHFDWLPIPESVPELTESLIAQHNPAWDLGGRDGTWPQWLPIVGRAGFDIIEVFQFDVDVEYSQRDWRGRIHASAGVGGSLESEECEAFDQQLALALNAQYGQDQLQVPHRVWALVAQGH